MILYHPQALQGGESASIRLLKNLTHSQRHTAENKLTNYRCSSPPTHCPLCYRPLCQGRRGVRHRRWRCRTPPSHRCGLAADSIRFTSIHFAALCCSSALHIAIEIGCSREITSASGGSSSLLGEGSNLSHLAHNLLGLQNIPRHRRHQTAKRN